MITLCRNQGALDADLLYLVIGNYNGIWYVTNLEADYSHVDLTSVTQAQISKLQAHLEKVKTKDPQYDKNQILRLKKIGGGLYAACGNRSDGTILWVS